MLAADRHGYFSTNRLRSGPRKVFGASGTQGPLGILTTRRTTLWNRLNCVES